jgi:CxxC motif-containing protein (DUF1111 family)
LVAKAVTFVPAFCFGLLAPLEAASAGGVIVPQPRSGEPLADLTNDEFTRFTLGKIAFDHTFTAPEGLGPIFNKASCSNCHNNRVGGAGSQDVTRFGFIDKNGFDPLEEYGGSLLQAQAISPECAEVVPPEANWTSKRITNSALAFGLVEAIPDQAILDVRDAQDPSVQGIAHMVFPFETPTTERVGRFGWKAQVATVLTFSADASQNELGLSNFFVPFDNAPTATSCSWISATPWMIPRIRGTEPAPASLSG